MVDRGRIVLVTGGSGFLGGHLVRRLAAVGRRVRVLSRSREIPGTPGVEWQRGDIRDREDCRKALEGVGTVFHAAALVPGRGAGTEYGEINAAGSANVAETCLSVGAERLILISSVSAYQAPFPTHVLESWPLEGVDAYGISKARAEAAIKIACAGRIPYAILRPCQIFGPRDSTGFTRRLLCLLGMRALPIPWGPPRTFCLVHVADVVECALRAEAAASLDGPAFNVAPSAGVTIRDLANSVRNLGSPPPILVPVPPSILATALSARKTCLSLARGGGMPSWRSHAEGRSSGTLFLGGPTYDTERMGQQLGFRAVTPIGPALAEIYGSGL